MDESLEKYGLHQEGIPPSLIEIGKRHGRKLWARYLHQHHWPCARLHRLADNCITAQYSSKKYWYTRKFHLQCLNLVISNSRSLRFIRNPEHGYDTAIFGLGNEFCDDADVIQGALSICKTHRSHEHVDGAKLSRMIPAILRARKRMVVKIDTNSVFPCPLYGLEKVSADLRELRLRP